MKSRPLLTAALALVILVFAGAYFGSPWLTAYQLMQAARDRDVATLEAHIDLPSVRTSLKSQLDEQLEAKLAKRARKNNALAQLGALFGTALVDKAVDATVTPETIAEAVRTARAPDPRKSAAPPPDGDGGDARGSSPKVKVRLAMAGLDRFDVRLSPADEPDRKLTLILRRQGLFGWKLTDVELPR